MAARMHTASATPCSSPQYHDTFKSAMYPSYLFIHKAAFGDSSMFTHLWVAEPSHWGHRLGVAISSASSSRGRETSDEGRCKTVAATIWATKSRQSKTATHPNSWSPTLEPWTPSTTPAEAAPSTTNDPTATNAEGYP
eukprot:GDKK01009653.1.p2 GENE.GDKK01009653.1~~GDKK01009653.1.p2  ORF type:complete len:138 (+),score=2.97 GDKK01009653.1:222-635(+)